MAKSLRNTTGSPISINDTGITIPASATYIIPPQDYQLWAASTAAATLISSGTLVVNDGYDDLKPQTGLKHITEESVPRSSAYNAAIVRTPSAASTLTLTATSRLFYTFSGAVAGQIIKLPNATTLNTGHRFEFWMENGVSAVIQYNDGTTYSGVGAQQRTTVTLIDNSTTNGIWVADSNFAGGGGSGTDLDTKQFGRQGTVSNNTVLLTLNNVLGDTSPDVCSYDFYLRRLSWSNSNNASVFNIRVWKYTNPNLTPGSKVIVYDYLTAGGRSGYMNFDVNLPIDKGESFYIEITTTGAVRPANLNVIVSLRQR